MIRRFFHSRFDLHILAVATLLLTCPASGIAQGVAGKPQSQSDHEEFVATVEKDGRVGSRTIMKALEKAWNLNNDSLIMKRAWRQLSGEEVGPTELKLENTGVILHKRANSGVPLETSDFQFAHDFDAKRKAYLGRFEGVSDFSSFPVSEGTREQIAEQSEFFSADEIPTCTENSSRKLPLPQPPEMDNKAWRQVKIPKKQQLLDFLLLPDFAPRELESLLVSYKDAFGQTTEVSFYQPNSGDTVSVYADRAGVKCLPFRVRVVGKHRFLHYGKDALMNYDEKAKGILHPVIARRLREFY